MRFFTGLIIGLFITAMLWLLAIYAQLNNPTPSWVHHAYELKTAAAQRIEQPKIVLVSGSNALFGIESQQMQQAWQRPVINYGVNAALLLPYILHKSKTVLKAGDIALLPIEYPLYLYNGASNAQLIDHILAREPTFLGQISWQEAFMTLWQISLTRIWQGYHPSDAQPPKHVLYGTHNIDPHTGDQLNTSQQQIQGQELKEWQALHNLKPHQYGKEDNPHNLAWDYLRAYIHWAKQQQVCLIFIPSAFHQHPSYRDNPVEQQFYSTLPEKIRALGVPYIGDPFDYMYPLDDLFNTEYHLTAEARQRHTAKLIQDLGDDLSQHCTQP